MLTAVRTLSCAVLLLTPALASAQSVDIVAPAPRVEANATPNDGLRDSIDPATDDAALAAALNYDPFSLGNPSKTFSRPVPKQQDTTTWDRKTEADGSGSISVKKLLQTEWDAKIGGDMALAGNKPAFYDPRTFDPTKPLPGTARDSRAGSAWANVAVPDVGRIEVRVAPGDDQRKMGTSLQRSMPLGGKTSLTLQNDISVTETYPATAAAAPTQIWDTERKLKLDIGATGTSLSAAASNTSVDHLTRHTFGAEQKVYGPLNVTTSVTDPGQPTSNKSIGANFKLNW